MTTEEKLDKLTQYVKTLAEEHNKLEKRVEELETAAEVEAEFVEQRLEKLEAEMNSRKTLELPRTK